MRAALWFSALFAMLGLLTGVAVFVLVRTGTLVATGAQPFGVLANLGLFGAVLAFLLHVLFGMVIALNQLWVPFTSLFLFTFGVVGAFRGRHRWYVALTGVALFLAGSLVQFGAGWVLDWLGSASEWDAAASTSAVAGTMLTAIGQVPLWGIWVWRWSNRAQLSQGALEERYWACTREVALVFGQLVSVFGAILLIAGEIGVIVYAWNRSGVLGVVLALVLGGFLFGIVAAIGDIVAMLIRSAAALSISLPIATVLVLLPRGKGSTGVSAHGPAVEGLPEAAVSQGHRNPPVHTVESALETARRILLAEAQDGYLDRVVIGGLAAFMANSARSVTSVTSDQELRTLTSCLAASLSDYGDLDHMARSRRVDRAAELVTSAMAEWSLRCSAELNGASTQSAASAVPVDLMAALKASIAAAQPSRSVAHNEPPMDDWCSCGRFECEGGESCQAPVADSLRFLAPQSEPAGADSAPA